MLISTYGMSQTCIIFIYTCNVCFETECRMVLIYRMQHSENQIFVDF